MTTHKLSAKFRTTAAVLLCAAALPAAAQAAPNDGRFGSSIEGMSGRPTSRTNCGATQEQYQIYTQWMKDAIAEGDYAASFGYQDDAASARTAARKAGCGWAWV